MTRDPAIRFVRLTEIPLETLVAHMADPRVAEHLPLLTGTFDRDAAARFVAAKEEGWRRDGLGHQAILLDGLYAGWGGLQNEGGEWDLGLVLTPAAFGAGPRIARALLEMARADPRVPFVTFLLAPSRRSLGALSRMGARPLGEVEHAGTLFRKYRLDTPTPGPHRLAIRVYYEDTDLAGVVYYANYLRFLERGRSEAIREAGIDQVALREAGLVFVVRRIVADYLRPARFDDLVTVETRLTAVKGASLTMDQAVTRGAETLLTAALTLACMDLSGRPMRIPAEIRRKLAGPA